MYLIYSPGLGGEDRIHIEGDGRVTARFMVTVTAIASSSFSMADTKKLARLYASAARAGIMQEGSLDGFADAISWVEHQNYPISKGVDAERNLMGVSDTYLVDVPGILNVNRGVPAPLENPLEAPDPWPTVDEGGGTAEVGLDPSNTVQGLTDSGFFGPQPESEET